MPYLKSLGIRHLKDRAVRPEGRGVRWLRVATPVLLLAAACGDDPVDPDPPGRARAPVASATIPDITLAVGDSVALDLTPYFSDPDGGTLVFKAVSSDASVATASVSGSTVTNRGVAKGTATVTVTATDPEGLSASQDFEVTVPNRSPAVADSIPDLELFRGDSARFDLKAHFADPDGDSLAFEATSSDASVATVSVSGDTITVLAVASGGTTATVTATDPEGLSASQDFEITVPNRLPAVADSIPDLELFRGDSARFDLKAHFADPDGDSLAFEATSSDASVATVSVSGDTITVLAVASGGTTATVTATDPEGLSASQDFEITATVPNRLPAVADSIPDLELFRGDSARFDLKAHFADPDGDSLAFEATSSDASVATVSVSGDTITVLAVASGGTTVTVTATDPEGLSASQDFEITATVPNRLPAVADSIPDLELFRGDSARFDLKAHFADPDGDSLAFEATSSDASVATVSVSGDTITVLAVASGGTTATVTATDPEGLSASQDFEITVPVRSGDRDVLEVLYRSMNGDAWVNRSNWLTDRPLHEWYGVRTDSNRGSGHRVIGLDLDGNNLTGPIPPETGDLDSLEDLNLSNNSLTGPIPRELGRLAKLQVLVLRSNRLTGEIPPEIGNIGSLESLILSYNSLTGSIPSEIGNLTNLRYLEIASAGITGPIPSELGRLAKLVALYLPFNRLTGEIPPEIGNIDSLERLGLNVNSLTGSIPSEIGNLTNLKSLVISSAGITGPIPPELGNLAGLTQLGLGKNSLTGSIPPELGKLANLEVLSIKMNQLSGEIPPELGNLASLTEIGGSDNNFTGPLPPELGNLENLRRLLFSDNSLSGSLPAAFGNLSELQVLRLDGNRIAGNLPWEIGGLAGLEVLDLENNDLSGPVPPEFEGLGKLRELRLTANSKMGSPLPDGLTALEDVRILVAGGTGLCAPRTPDFREWLGRIPKVRISSCGEKPAAYLTQAVQSREFPVPLIAGERALLRVFLTAGETNGEDLPGVTVRLYADDGEIHSERIAGKPGPIPTAVDEGDLGKSVNAEIPGGMIREDLEMVIEVDSVDASLGVPRRIPEEGRMAIEVDSMPTLEITAIPLLWTSRPDSTIIDTVAALSREPMEHRLFHVLRTLLPVAGVEVTAHAPVESSTNHAARLFYRIEAIRVMEGGTGHYMGMLNFSGISGALGAANTPGRSSVAITSPRTIAHELGHNMSLPHAPCGTPNPDPSFPYPDGRIGAWGWDFETETLVHPRTPDILTYCGPPWWISDYHFTNAARFRLSDEGNDALPGPPGPSLLLWGGVHEDGTPFLEPAFAVNAPPALPDAPGDYRLVGLRADSTELFSLTFGMLDVADGEGASGFAFVLPAGPGWDNALAGIRLSGPAGSATVDLETRRPMAILRDRTTGQVRAFLDGVPTDTSGFEVRFSRGIPDPDAWR